MSDKKFCLRKPFLGIVCSRHSEKEGVIVYIKDPRNTEIESDRQPFKQEEESNNN